MQRLHVVGFTTDHEGLILSARRNTKSGGYMVIADADLEQALSELRRARGGESDDEGSRSPRPESTLSVREMQQRLRGGQSITEVAKIAGVAEEWIARFAVPIQAEQSQIVSRALELVVSKQRVGPSSQPLGTSVWWNLQDRGAKLLEADWTDGWSAYMQRDQVWVVRFSYTFRKKQQAAEWEIDMRSGALHSRNRLGTDLGYVEPGRRRRAGPPKPLPGGLVSRPASAAAPEPAGEPAKKPARKSPTRAAPKRTPTKKKKKPVAKRASVKKKPAAKRAPVKKKPAAKRVPVKKKAAAKRAPAGRGATKKASAAGNTTRALTMRKAQPARLLVPSPSNTGRAVALATPRPVISAAPAPGSARPRPVGADGRPVRRRSPLRAR